MSNSFKKGLLDSPMREDEATEASPHPPGLNKSKHSSSGSLKSLVIFEDEANVPGIEEDEREGTDIFEDRGGAFPISRRVHRPHAATNRLSQSSSRRLEKYAPISWIEFFDEQRKVVIPGTRNVFNIYLAGKEGPVVFCLHGGGYSGLSFAPTAKFMKDKVRVVAMDLRGHGASQTENESDLSVQTLSADVAAVITALFGETNVPAIVLVGHSMGGALAVHLAARQAIPTLAGLVVVDVVEGTAMASLTHMQAILSARPSNFTSVERAVEWSFRGGSLRNLDSARVSVPPTVVSDENGRFVWRTKLEASESHWKQWYEGLSNTFLGCPVPKLLLLAGTDRLDKALTIAQMQGKFQMLVVRHSGHAIQEDEPEEFASAVLGFLSRNRVGAQGPVIPRIFRP